MKKKTLIILNFLIYFILLAMCNNQSTKDNGLKIRQLIDTIGFTQYKWQMDSIISRIDADDKKVSGEIYKTIICPHDDYAYAAGLYNKTLEGIKSKTIVLIGVAHKAKNFNLENKLIFDSFNKWKSIDTVNVSPIRTEILENLSKKSYLVHDSMMQLEHSLEAIIPFLEKSNKDVEIIPILVPYMTFENMDLFSDELSKALYAIMTKENLKFGEDLSIVISNDAIHYGNEDWGGKDMAPFGVDSIGNEKAIQKDLDIIKQCLEGELSKDKIIKFNQITVDEKDFKAYKWTWCGRYSVPFGLLLANKLNQLFDKASLSGKLIDYRNSLHNKHIEVKDIGMGYTAPAKHSHWVGYAGIAYK
jgi:MEMO1 family protein